MLEQLKKHFGEKMVVANDEHYSENFSWFMTNDHIKIGISTEQLTEEEQSLLNVFLTPVTRKQLETPQSVEEKFWSQILFGAAKNVTKPHGLTKTFRFIHFYLRGETSDTSHLVEAITSLLPETAIILLESDSSGVIIDTDPDSTDQIENLFESISNTITSDFYLDLALYIGLKNSCYSEAHNRYLWEKNCFEIMKQTSSKTVYYGEEVVPYLLLFQANQKTLEDISTQLLGNVVDDKELIKSIRIYLDCNMNVSHAAKKLYLHRNTLQYRVEKFIERTGIDIRHFNNAVSIYLALLINNSKA
ncbi:PucR family transcriptional regulator [Halalkalibacter krulwichiae]|uniref:Leucine-rich protein n=1 Tax=Halalkalibacter krulwichiae TaxID=199441 RepID=A0A1X9MCS7_9BACI|nr:helix-turn-helix domain-containing protein [Halalkalibacter krulwichiae]ARK31216.1 Leucine-rich protein [Halalkalibacter krulwichiae]